MTNAEITLEQLLKLLSIKILDIEAPLSNDADIDIDYVCRDGHKIAKILTESALTITRIQAERGSVKTFLEKTKKLYDENKSINDGLHRQIHRLSKSK